MHERNLGETDVQVSPIGLGCWQFSQGKGFVGSFWGEIEQEMVSDIVKVSLEKGITWFDTAEAYGWGRSEETLSKALKDNGREPGDVVVATKWFPFLRTKGSIIKTFDKRIEALEPFAIDLHQIHFPLALATIKGMMQKMADLYDQNRIRAIGVSNFSAKQMRKAQAILKERGCRLASNQVRYSLLDRGIEDNGILDTAKELGITIIAYSPLSQGLLTGKFHENPEAITSRPGPRKRMKAFRKENLDRTAPLIHTLRSIGEGHDKSPAQIALNWIINRHGETVVAIPGASKVQHARQNAESMQFTLTEDELLEIDRVSRSVLQN